MTADTSARLLKALADPTRLRIVHSLVAAPSYVEALAAGLGLTAPTISHHLRRLEEVGLVSGTRDQYYTVYRVRLDLLQSTLRALVDDAGDARTAEQLRLDAYRGRILGTFFADGRLRQMPAQRKKKLVVLAAFAADFAPGRTYAEDEVNAAIGARFDDYCTVRRELVDARIMDRTRDAERGVLYRLADDAEVTALPPPGAPPRRAKAPDRAERKAKVELYKQSVRRAGVYGIRNRQTGRLLLGSSLNLHGPLNRHRAELRFGSHRCRSLQDDWNALGPDGFEFAVLAAVDETLVGTARDAALRALELAWIAQLQPFAEHCYNTSEQIRTKPY